MQICPAASRRVMPWKNGGGSTAEIAVFPPGASLDDFDWRISMARVEADGPFSFFPGVDRTLTLLDGDGLELRSHGKARILTADDPTLRFAGEEPIAARLIAGPLTDFNVMTRRACCRHDLSRLRLSGEQPLRHDGTTVVFLAQGDRMRCRGGGKDIVLGHRDGLILEPEDPAEWRLSADSPAVVFVVAIREQRVSPPA
jgi:environmental stress-induced protein Ves